MSLFKRLDHPISKKLLRFSKTEFFTALSTTSLTTGIMMITGIVINKIIAIKIGPTGIALLGQFDNFKSVIASLATGSFGNGVTKYISDPVYDNKKILATSNIFILLVSVVIGTIIAVFSKSLSIFLLKTEEFKYIFIVFGLVLPLLSIDKLILRIVNGYRNFKLLAYLKTTGSIVGLIMSGLLCWYFLIDGALLAKAINTSIVLIISLGIIIFSFNIKDYISYNVKLFNINILKKLLGFSIMALVSILLTPLIELYIRNYIIEHANKFDAGIWEATKRLSKYYLTVITTALGAYYLPKLSSLNTKKSLRIEIFYGLKVILPIFCLLAFGIFILKGFIIQFLYAKEFEPMKQLIFPQLVGDFFMIASFMTSYLMLAKAMIKLFVISQISFGLLRIFLSITFFNIGGIMGIIWANALQCFIYCIFISIVFRDILFFKAET